MKHGLFLFFFLFLSGFISSAFFMPGTGFAGRGITPGAGRGERQPIDGFLYYIDRDGKSLKAVAKKFSPGLNPHDLGIAIMEDLIKGASINGLEPVLPAAAKVNALFILGDGRAYIDFDQSVSTQGSYSAQQEMLAIYSIVNSLVLNIEEINRVKILIQGETAQTLSGHINLDCFYEANVLIVK